MAFGASASVLSFNWTAAALCMALVRLLRIGATIGYDGVTDVEVEGLAASATEAGEVQSRLPSWQIEVSLNMRPGCLLRYAWAG